MERNELSEQAIGGRERERVRVRARARVRVIARPVEAPEQRRLERWSGFTVSHLSVNELLFLKTGFFKVNEV